jgi:hypothetical protein
MSFCPAFHPFHGDLSIVFVWTPEGRALPHGLAYQKDGTFLKVSGFNKVLDPVPLTHQEALEFKRSIPEERWWGSTPNAGIHLGGIV